MSVAPDIAPDVIIPARARRGSRDRVVSGNVISPTAFHDTTPPPIGDEVRVLRLLPGLEAGEEVRLYVRTDHRLGTPLQRPVVGDCERPSSVRLTHRGRWVLALSALVVALGIVVGAWFGAAGSADPGRPATGNQPAQVMVHDGDTLWSIAAAVAPGRDPRATVESLQRLNGLNSAALVPGQVLRLR